MTWYNPGELTEHAVSDLAFGKTPERVVHEEVQAFVTASEDPELDGPDESLDEFLRFMLDEWERARHFFARLQIAAVYALAQAERDAVPEGADPGEPTMAFFEKGGPAQ